MAKIKNVAVQMDHVSTVNIAGDSTFAMSLEAQARGYNLFHYTPDRLSLPSPPTYRMQPYITPPFAGGGTRATSSRPCRPPWRTA